MKVIENRCCNCSSPAYPCVGEFCKNRKYEAHYCDICGKEISKENNYYVDEEEVCENCYKKEFGDLEEEE